MSRDPTIKKATLEDLLAIPEEERDHEIIDGVLYKRDAARAPHGKAQFHFGDLLAPYNRKPSGTQPGGWVFVNETEVLLNEGDIYRPDVAGWRRERWPVDEDIWPVRVVPDWICEVLSTDKRRDTIWKMRGYHRAKLCHYWLVDPDERTLVVHRWHAEGWIHILDATAEETVRAEPFDQISFFVGRLFGLDEPEAEEERR